MKNPDAPDYYYFVTISHYRQAYAIPTSLASSEEEAKALISEGYDPFILPTFLTEDIVSSKIVSEADAIKTFYEDGDTLNITLIELQEELRNEWKF